ncbi:MAG: lysophospholipid acyltransferase family protein [Verrucomicrobiia bacterium]
MRSRVVRRLFVRVMKGTFGLRIRNLDLVPTVGPYIFASNHASNYDLLLALAAFCEGTTQKGFAERFPVPVVWRGMLDIPILGSLINALPCVWVSHDLGKEDERVAALRKMIEYLRAGQSLVIACEGRRGDALTQFQQGAAFVSLYTGVPVVPISLRGAQGLFSGLSRPDRYRGNVEVVLHRPLAPATFEAAGGTRAEIVARFTEVIRDTVAADLDYGMEDTSAKQ